MKKNFIRLVIPIICVLVSLLGACNKTQNNEEGEKKITVEDDYGLKDPAGGNRELSFDKPIERAIVGETGCAMALHRMGVSNKVIAATEYIAGILPGYENVPSIGSKTGIDLEFVLSLKPDLILSFKSHSDQATEQLIDAGHKVYSIGTIKSLDHIKKHVINCGLMFGVENKADEIIAEMESIETRVKTEIKKRGLSESEKPTVFMFGMMGDKKGLQTWAPGKNTIIEDLVARAGGRLITVEHGLEGWKEYNVESLLVADPEIIIIALGEYDWESKEEFMNVEMAKELTAVKENRVYAIDSALVFRLSYQNIYALKEFARFISGIVIN